MSTYNANMGQIRLIQIKDGSDADATHLPNPQTHTRVNEPHGYFDKLGTMWMQHTGKAQPNITYRIDKLPNGYTVWERPRSSKPNHVDKWCFGHPTRKFFDSPVKFFPHFLSLMENGNADNCTCINCDTKHPSRSRIKQVVARPQAKTALKGPRESTLLPSHPRGRPPGRPAPIDTTEEGTQNRGLGLYKAKGRQWVEGRTDEEGTPDPYRNNIDRLRTLGFLDTIIEEPMSPDWRAESTSGVDTYLKALRQKPAWQPRRMEIVLFVRALQPNETLLFDSSIKRFMISANGDGEQNALKEPLWEAGVVTQAAQESRSGYSITSSGFRVEPLSNANQKNGKGIWKQYTYVRADQLRPFSLWKNLLPGTDHTIWHPTIENAMLVMSTVTLVKRYRFKGKWPEAKIYCRGMYLGSELLVEGDFVYLLPEGDDEKGVTDVMRIDGITLDLWNLDKASADDYDEGHPYNSAARVTGMIYTIDPKRAFDNDSIEMSTISPSTNLDWLGSWFAHTPSDKLSRIPFHRILGRCHDLDLVEQWLDGMQQEFGSEALANLGLSLEGVVDGRAYSSAEYRHIDKDRTWFWADTRAQALDLEEINGWLVSSQDPSRDPKKYRKEIRVIEGTARPEERLALQQAERRTIPRTAANRMVASALEIDDADDPTIMTRDAKRNRDLLSDSEDNIEEGIGEDEGSENGHFVDQMVEGLAMTDEEIPSSTEDDNVSAQTSTMRHKMPTSIPLVIIDD